MNWDREVPTKRMQNVLDRLEARYVVQMKVLVQPTHYFPFNALEF